MKKFNKTDLSHFEEMIDILIDQEYNMNEIMTYVIDNFPAHINGDYDFINIINNRLRLKRNK